MQWLSRDYQPPWQAADSVAWLIAWDLPADYRAVTTIEATEELFPEEVLVEVSAVVDGVFDQDGRRIPATHLEVSTSSAHSRGLRGGVVLGRVARPVDGSIAATDRYRTPLLARLGGR